MSQALLVLALVVLTVGCSDEEPPAFTYFDDRVAPVLDVGCAQQTTGCHVATSAGTASGNLDLSSYDALLKREDVLPASGPYSVGQLLLKGGDPIAVPVQTFDPPDPATPERRFVTVTTDVRHAGGRSLRQGSDGYARLKSWIQQGYAESGAPREPAVPSVGPCREEPGTHRGFDARSEPADREGYARFVRDVQPVLRARCASASCHGTPNADLYLTCGTTDAALRWNYFAARAHVDLSPSLSELLRRPLAKQRGGTFHEGGTVFASTDDPDYVRLRGWAEDLVARAPSEVVYDPDDPGLRFFGNYVQPMLVKKGCMFGNCHAPAMFHDLRLRGGSGGVFSRIAIDRNYDMVRLLLSTESPDPNDSRLVAKNLFPPERGGAGLAHRGGALLEDFQTPARAEACAGVDVTKQSLDQVPAYCVLVAFHALERQLAIQRGEVDPADEVPLVYVSRPTGVGDPRDFDTYRPGADLVRAPLTLRGDAAPTLGVGTSLLAGCGLRAEATDVRGVAVSWDATHLAFGARSAPERPLRLYEIELATGTCRERTDLAPDQLVRAGVRLHDFDPAYAPDGRLVFASTRGDLEGGGGPSRTPSQLAPNANLYVYEPAAQRARQVTFLSNQELQPSFMVDGRLVYTAEKRALDFFQLAGRRQNLDGGDFHPLYAQRGSIGFSRATEIVELANRDFALVAAPADAADGAGALAIVNRSIGPDQSDRDPGDRLYLHSLRIPLPGALGGQRGAYRSPAALPSRWLVASCDPDARSLTTGGYDFDLCAIDSASGELVRLGGAAGRAEIEAVAIYPRTSHGVFASRLDEVNGHTRLEPGARDAEVHVLDVPLLSTLLFANTRSGRPIDPRVAGVEVLTQVAPPVDATSFAALPDERVLNDAYGPLYVHQESLGRALAESDGSTRLRLPGGRAFSLALLGARGEQLSFAPGAPFTGTMVQREELQLFPGERASFGFKRALFDGMCGGCHGSVSGREVDVAVDVDALTRASETLARDKPPRVLGAP